MNERDELPQPGMNGMTNLSQMNEWMGWATTTRWMGWYTTVEWMRKDTAARRI